MSFELILASPPEHCKNALLWGVPVAHMAYKSCGAHLYRTALPDSLRKGLMLITNYESGDTFNPDKAVSQILEECKSRSFSGVIADFEPPCTFADRFLPILSTELKRRKMDFYVSEWSSALVGDCNVVLSTAISGGTLVHRLNEAAKLFGYGNMVLDLEILCHDFLLPAYNGRGRKIPKKRVYELLDYTGVKAQFSHELCCNYFTYKNQQGLHFVLFDDALSVSKKLQLAQGLGIKKAIILYPEADSSIIRAAINL